MRIIELERSACEGKLLLLTYDSYAVWTAQYDSSDETTRILISKQKQEKKHVERPFSLLQRSDSRVLGLLDDTGVRGLAEVSGGENLSSAMLETFCVFEGYRRRGYGTLLMNRVKEKLRLSGSGGITARVPFDDSGAVAFLEKQGFRITGFDPAPEKSYTSAILMNCLLR